MLFGYWKEQPNLTLPFERHKGEGNKVLIYPPFEDIREGKQKLLIYTPFENA